MISGSTKKFQDFYQSIYPPVDGMDFLQSVIVGGDGSDMVILKTLENIRKEITAFNTSNSNVKWTSQLVEKRRGSGDYDDDIKWDMKYGTIFVVRYTTPKYNPYYLNAGRSSWISLRTNAGAIEVAIYSDSNLVVYDKYLPPGKGSMGSIYYSPFLYPGKHSTAIINNAGRIRVMFDFKVSIDFQNPAGPRKVDALQIDGALDTVVEVDQYRFG